MGNVLLDDDYNVIGYINRGTKERFYTSDFTKGLETQLQAEKEKVEMLKEAVENIPTPVDGNISEALAKYLISLNGALKKLKDMEK